MNHIRSQIFGSCRSEEAATKHAHPAFAPLTAEAPWHPGANVLSESCIARFIERSAEPTLEAVQARAVRDPAWFWDSALEDLGLPWQRQPDRVLDLDRGAPFARWWPGGGFNLGRAALASIATGDERPSLIWEGEDGEVVSMSRDELRQEVASARERLRSLSIGRGSRVGLLLPMLAESAIILLALAQAEAVVAPIFSGYGAPAIAERLEAFGATHLITANGFRRRGRMVHLKDVADIATASPSSVQRVVVRRDGGPDVSWNPSRDRWWHEDPPLSSNSTASGTDDLLVTDSNAPFMVMYTSGTTGRPKGTVHTHAGFAVKVAQDLTHTFDVRPGDRLCWISDLGWLMGPWAIFGSLLVGASVVIYEGAPDFPGPDRLWDIATRHDITHIGLSPTLARSLRLHGPDPVRSHDARSLRVIGSTGEAWDDDAWNWVFSTVGNGRLPIINYSGGTEVAGGILGSTVVRPIRPSSFNGPCVGMAAAIVDPSGHELTDGLGELVVNQPWPGMTRGFWEQPDERYAETYWYRWGDRWNQGDWASVDREGFWYVRGRSDDTLNLAGKRFGPAEIENAAAGHPLVSEAAAIGVPHAVKGIVVVVLCVPKVPAAFDTAAAAAIAQRVVDALGPTVRPYAVVAVAELPRTRSGKTVRRAARAAYLAIDPGDLSSIENPSALVEISKAGVMSRRGELVGG